MRLQEGCPRSSLAPLGCRLDPVVVQDPLHRAPGDRVAEIRERAADPGVAPRRILDRHPHHEFGDLPSCHRPASTPAAGAAVVFHGDQTPVPAQDRIWGDDAGHLTQDPPAEFLAAYGESATLGVGQAQRSRPQVLPEDPILLPEIVDQVFLVAIHPASDGQYEELQRRGHRLRVPAGGWDRFRPRRLFRTLRGHIRRVEGSTEPNGVLEEEATRLVGGGFAGLEGGGDIDEVLRRTIELYTSYGTTTIQNGGGTGPETAEAIRAAAEREPLDADVAGFTSVDAIMNESLEYEPTYSRGFRLAGVKFVLDGSPQGRTAWVTEPYHEGPPGAAADYRAYGTMDADLYKAGAAALIERGVPFLVHANGDAAMDLMMDGVEEASRDMDEAPDHRSVIIHAQLMHADQLDRAARLGVVPSFFSAHTFFWGDWHVRSFGEARGTNISPVRWAIDRGVNFTIHNDAPVVPPDIMRLISITVNRKGRSGRVRGPHQRATVQEALHAVTLGTAYQYFEEDANGSITVWKQADLVILGQNPLATDPAELEHIPILETFSRGRSVYQN